MKQTPDPSDSQPRPLETAPDAQVSLVYVGPPEQTSPALGPLVAGRRYQMAADFAAYLVSTHPDYWQAAPTQAATE